MATEAEKQPQEADWPILEVWSKYEQIAMHFNDLLMKLRTQALAGVAALATVVGVFSKSSADQSSNWEIVAFAFAILAVFWLAIWILDFCYYNRLLLGAAEALFRIENESKTKTHIRQIDMSTMIKEAVIGNVPHEGIPNRWELVRGRWLFYGIVFFVLLFGFLYAACRHS